MPQDGVLLGLLAITLAIATPISLQGHQRGVISGEQSEMERNNPLLHREHATEIPSARTQHRAPGSALASVHGPRKFPYPYKAMLAISSDSDHLTLRKFVLIHRFLNTTLPTPMGKGLGLDVADSFYLYNASDLDVPIDHNNTPPSQQMTYFHGITTRPYYAAAIDKFVRCGWVDTMHTYGDFSMKDESRTRFHRRLAKAALHILDIRGTHVTIWVNHGNKSNVDNFGANGLSPFFDYQSGDNPRSKYYHTDLLIPYGIHFVWDGQAGYHFGQSSAIYPIHLRDGQDVWGFHRFTSMSEDPKHPTRWVWSAEDLSTQLDPRFLRRVEDRHEYAILAQHLAGNNTKLPLPMNGITALRHLRDEEAKGHILVARTSRLLRYNVTQKYLRYSTRVGPGGEMEIHLVSIDDPLFSPHPPSLPELRGVTFYTSNPTATRLFIGNRPLPESLVQRNPSDGKWPSIGVKWFPKDTRDYS